MNEERPIVIYKGDDTDAFGAYTITIRLKTDLDLTGATAEFSLLSIKIPYDTTATASKVFPIVFTKEQTKAMPLGVVYGTFRVFKDGKVATAAMHIPFEVVYPGVRCTGEWQKKCGPIEIECTLGVDYNYVFNKPTINGIPLVGDVKLEDIGVATKEALDQEVARAKEAEKAVGEAAQNALEKEINRAKDAEKTVAESAQRALSEEIDRAKKAEADILDKASGVFNGYLFDGKFWKDEEHTEEIAKRENRIYIDIPTNEQYRWDETSETFLRLTIDTTNFVKLKGEQSQEIEGKVIIDDVEVRDDNLVERTSLAEEFSTEKTYPIDDIVFYAGRLYRCKNEIATPGPWTGDDDWEVIQLKDIGKTVIINKEGVLRSLSKIAPYLFEAECGELSSQIADQFFRKHFLNGLQPVDGNTLGFCSSFRDGKFLGRAYDWKYDEAVSFVVHTPADGSRYASVAVCGSPSGITRELVENLGVSQELWDVMPFFALDGINENGVACNVNVVPAVSEGGVFLDTHEFCAIAAVRKVLDLAKTAEEGAHLIAEKAWMPKVSLFGGNALHFMVADKNKTFVVEDGKVFDITNESVKAMTNFRVGDKDFLNNEGTAVDLTRLAAYEPYGTGVERYDIILNALKNNADEEEVDHQVILDSLKFSLAYSDITDSGDTERSSEFAGAFEIAPGVRVKVNQTAEIQAWFKAEDIHGKWNNRTRNGEFWQTVHMSLYDFEDKSLVLKVQEGEDQFSFNIDKVSAIDAYTKSEVDNKINQFAAHYLTWKNDDGQFVQFSSRGSEENPEKGSLAWAVANHTEENPQFWYGDEPHTPDKNDYCTVADDETQGGGTTRYMFVGDWGDGYFRFQYKISSSPMDENVTETSENGVKSKGIWAFVKGLLTGFVKLVNTTEVRIKTSNRLFLDDRLGKNFTLWDGRGEGFTEVHGKTNGIEMCDGSYINFRHADGGIGLPSTDKLKFGGLPECFDNGKTLTELLNEKQAKAVLTLDGQRVFKNGTEEITTYSALLTLIKAGGVVLLDTVAGQIAKEALFHPHMADETAIRFDATGMLGEKVYTRSFAFTPKSDGGIAVSRGNLTEVAKKSDIPEVTAPASDASLSGKAADAYETGKKLDAKASLASAPTFERGGSDAYVGARNNGANVRLWISNVGSQSAISIQYVSAEGEFKNFKIPIEKAGYLEELALVSQLSGITAQDVEDFLKYKGDISDKSREDYWDKQYKTGDIILEYGRFSKFLVDVEEGDEKRIGQVDKYIPTDGFQKLVDLYEKNKALLFTDTAFSESVKETAPDGSLAKKIYDLQQGCGGGGMKYDATTGEYYQMVEVPDEEI